jgi:hypothetical protein
MARRTPVRQIPQTLTRRADAWRAGKSKKYLSGSISIDAFAGILHNFAMQLETFRAFCNLAQTHRLTVTARHFGLTRKAARRQLALLERQFKTELADYPFPKIQFTRAGRICRPYCARIAETIRRLDAELQEARELAANEFHLAVCFSNRLPSTARPPPRVPDRSSGRADYGQL